MSAEKSGAAPFDDSRKALVFALNAHQVSPPVPFMNKAMAAVKARRRKAKEGTSLRVLQDAEEARAAERRQKWSLKAGNWPARGLDAAHLAGYILQTFGTLPEVHRVVLTGRLTQAAVPCSCGNPCCSGWRPVDRWLGAVTAACAIVKNQALVIANEGRIPGAPMRVGLSTQPALRRKIIKDWFTGRETALVDLAVEFGLTSVTVARHRAWITEWLDTVENNAWLEVDALFDRTGITGPFL